jgi:RNA polymerase-binding transcription factor DksA
MDFFDKATETEELERDAAIAAARAARQSLAATGKCHSCGAAAVPGARFCDVDCRDDFERSRQRARVNGR